MADTFHNLEEAAKLLNVTPEKLGEMRDNGEIRGFRDGTTWKFKTSEIEKLTGQAVDADDTSDIGFADEGDDEVTMLGEAPDLAAMLESIEDDEDDSESSAELGAAASLLINDGGSSGSVIGSSEEGDLELASPGDDSADDAHVLDDSELLLQEEGGTGDLDVSADGDDFTFDSSELDDSSGDMELSDDDFALSDDDLVLSNSDSAANSDITLGSGDSGINLGSPSDSGISLDEEPLELAGGSSSALGLPEDSGLSLGDDLSDSEDFGDLQKDDEFLLSPSDDAFGDSSDSGSQVIALSDSQAFDEDAATMIADRMFEEDPLDSGMLLEEESPMDADPAMGLGAEMDPTLAGAAVGFQQEVLPPVQAIEAPYSIWNLMGLSCVLMLLVLTGISMTDVVRNMWTWQEPYEVSNSVMNMFVKLYSAIRDMIG